MRGRERGGGRGTEGSRDREVERDRKTDRDKHRQTDRQIEIGTNAVKRQEGAGIKGDLDDMLIDQLID